MYKTILENSIVFNNFYTLFSLYKSEKILFALNATHAKKHKTWYINTANQLEQCFASLSIMA